MTCFTPPYCFCPTLPYNCLVPIKAGKLQISMSAFFFISASQLLLFMFITSNTLTVGMLSESKFFGVMCFSGVGIPPNIIFSEMIFGHILQRPGKFLFCMYLYCSMNTTVYEKKINLNFKLFYHKELTLIQL